METIICPFCKEHYQVKNVVEYKRFICGRCGRKHIYHNGRLVPFSLSRREDGASRIEVCAYCKNDFTLEENASGEYICPFCNNILYILPPSGVMPGGSPDEAPHALAASGTPEDISKTVAIPHIFQRPTPISDDRGFVEEPRRSIDIRRLPPPPPPPRRSSIFGNQPTSGDFTDNSDRK